MSNNQTSWQLTQDLLSDDGQKITFVLSTAAERGIVAYCPLSNDIKLSELDTFAMIAPSKVIPLTDMMMDWPHTYPACCVVLLTCSTKAAFVGGRYMYSKVRDD